MSLALVLHDLGDPDGGAGWRAVLPAETWEAPDLPGHGLTPIPRHGAYDPQGPCTLARWRVAHHGVEGSLVVGVGENAHAALLVAAGGACGAVAVVDGLWGPWGDPHERVATMYDLARATLADPACTAAPPSSGTDPRAALGYGIVATPRLCQRFWAAVDVPALLIETARSSTPPAEREERASWFGGPTTLVDLAGASPTEILAAIAQWWGR